MELGNDEENSKKNKVAAPTEANLKRLGDAQEDTAE
jgi:hypothetical protein